MTKFCAIFSLVTFCFTFVQAQEFSVTGSIRDSLTHEELIGVNIILTQQNNPEKKYYAVTDIEGNFRFPGVAAATYRLAASYVGYENLEKPVVVTDKPVQLGTLLLTESVEIMDALVVTGKIQQTVVKGDTTQFNAGAFKTSPNASSQDLVEKMPGIVVVDGKLQAQGEDVQQILVDGKPFFGGDVNAALQNLPAEVVASIQVFDKKSDKAALSGFDDGESKKTINIVTKPDRRRGQFGKATAGYGSNDRYDLGASVNFFSDDRRFTVTGLSNNINKVKYSANPNSQGESRTQDGIINTNNIGFNFIDDWGEKVEISASYLFSHRENESSSLRSRDYILPSDSGQVYTEDSQNNRINMDHNFSMRLEYNIDSSNRLIVRPDISLRHDRNDDSFFGRTVTDNGPLNQTENFTNSDNSDYNFTNRIHYSHRFRKKGRSLTVGLHGGYYTNKDDAYRQANNIFYRANDSIENLNQHSLRDRSALSWETEISYTEPIGKYGMTEIEYEINNKSNSSDKLSYNIFEEGEAHYERLDTALSNTFDSEYLNQDLELGYQYRNEKLRLQVEASYERADLMNDQFFPQAFDISRTYTSVLPSFRFDYNFSKTNRLEFDYRTWTNAPSIGQLQHVIDNSNPLRLSTGNPGLDQSYQNWIRARYRANNPETNQTLYAAVSSSFINNYIASSALIAEEPVMLDQGLVLEKGSQLTRPVNVNGYFHFGSYISYGQPVDAISSNFNINGGVSYTKRPGMINDEINFSNSSNFRLGLGLSSNINERIDFNLSTRSGYNIVKNTLRPALNNNYFNQTTRLRYNWIFWNGFVYRANIDHYLKTGLSAGYDNSYFLVNMSLGKKFLKNDLAEISLNVYDLLEQNNNISRSITELYIQDSQSTVLQRYLMLTLTYNIRHFSKGTTINDYKEIQEIRGLN